MMCEVYYADASSFSLDKALAEATAERREKAMRFRSEKNKRLCIGAEKLLFYALKRHSIKLPSSYYKGEHDKPYIDGAFFSFSHSGKYAVCAFSDAEVGCDIEKVAPCDLKLAKRFFAPTEYDFIGSSDESKRDDLFFRCWTLKESFVKAVGTGLSLPFRDFCIDLTGQFSISYKDKEYCFAEYDGIDGYKLAVCTQGRMPVKFIKIDLD